MKHLSRMRIPATWWLVGLIGLITSPLIADILTLNNGDELFGTVRSLDAKGIQFERNGTIASYSVDQLLKLEFETLKMPPGEDTVDRIQDSLVKELMKKIPSAEAYPQAARLDVLDEEVYELKDAGTWDYTARQVFVPFKETARDDANHSFGYFPDLERAEVVYGRSITAPESGVLGLLGGRPGSVRYVSDHTIADEADFGTIPLYQRRHTVKFAIPEVAMGSIVDRQYRIQRFKADPLKPFLAEKLFRGREPASTIRLIVRAPRSLDLVFQVIDPEKVIKVTSTEKDQVHEWCFEASNTEGLIDESLMPELERLAPRVVIGQKNSWKSVATEYEKCLAPLRAQALSDPALDAVVSRICSGTQDLSEKIRRLFTFTARDIGDVDVFPDWYSWQPHEVSQILQAKQANHVDRAFLYHCLLLKAGVESRILPVRWRMLGEVATEVPSLMQMSGMVVEIAPAVASFPMGLPVMRDMGPEVTPGYLQGANALRLSDASLAAVAFVPAKQEGNRSVHEGEVTPDGGLKMKTTLRPLGGTAGDWRGMRDYSRKEQEKYLESMLHEMIPGARLLSFTLANLDDTASTPVLQWEWEVASYALRSGDDLLVIPLPVNRKSYSASAVGPMKRRYPLSWEVLRRDDQQISLRLPEGYTVYALPEGDYASARGMIYHSKFGFSVNRVLFTDTLERHVVDLEASEYADYKKLIESRSQTADQWIIIKRTR